MSKQNDGGAKAIETFIGSMPSRSSHVQFACGCASFSWGMMQHLKNVFGDVDCYDGYTVKIVVMPNAMLAEREKQ